MMERLQIPPFEKHVAFSEGKKSSTIEFKIQEVIIVENSVASAWIGHLTSFYADIIKRDE